MKTKPYLIFTLVFSILTTSMTSNAALIYWGSSGDTITFKGTVSTFRTGFIGSTGFTMPDAGTCFAYDIYPGYQAIILLLATAYSTQKPITMTCDGPEANIKSIRFD